MTFWEGRITERDIYGRLRLTCPPERIPAPGQYLLAWNPGETDSLLAVPVFLAELAAPEERAVWLAPATPCTGNPGEKLRLRGPLGNGFRLPPGVRRLAAFVPRRPPWRVLPLIQRVLREGGAVVLFSGADTAHLPLPAALEILPPAAFPETLRAWADYWVADLPLEDAADISSVLGSPTPPVPGAVLVDTPMPCGGLADCGVCALSINGKTILACKQGPVVKVEGGR